MPYTLELNRDEKALLQNAIISLKYSINDAHIEDRLDDLLYRVQTLQPKAVFSVSILPRFHATSMACRIARSTLLALVPKCLAMPGYSSLVMRLMMSGWLMTIFTACFKN